MTLYEQFVKFSTPRQAMSVLALIKLGYTFDSFSCGPTEEVCAYVSNATHQISINNSNHHTITPHKVTALDFDLSL